MEVHALIFHSFIRIWGIIIYNLLLLTCWIKWVSFMSESLSLFFKMSQKFWICMFLKFLFDFTNKLFMVMVFTLQQKVQKVIYACRLIVLYIWMVQLLFNIILFGWISLYDMRFMSGLLMSPNAGTPGNACCFLKEEKRTF